MTKGRLSTKRGLFFSLLAIVGFVAWLYLATFAGILLLAYRTGLVVIEADSLMPVESALMLSASIVVAFITIYSVAAIASDITNVRVFVDMRSRFYRKTEGSKADTYR